MSTETRTSGHVDLSTSRWTILLAYLGAVVAAELLIAFAGQELGLAIHILLVFALILFSVVISSTDAALAPLLVAASLASLIRVFSLAVPRFGPDILPWLLLVSVAVVVYVQRLSVRDLGLWPIGPRQLLVQIAIGLTGVPLGVIEFFILRPRPGDWISDLGLQPFLFGSAVIFLATGVSEELIFRGIMLRRAIDVVGTHGGILFVTSVFAALHIFFRNPQDLAFVFGVGLLYAIVVIRTKSLWGAIMSHSLGNIVLYLTAPFVLG